MFVFWFVSMFLIGLLHLIILLVELKQIKLWNIVLGIYHFPLTIIALIGYGCYWICAESCLSKRLNKIYADWN
jgi:hypothetical protein